MQTVNIRLLRFRYEIINITDVDDNVQLVSIRLISIRLTSKLVRAILVAVAELRLAEQREHDGIISTHCSS